MQGISALWVSLSLIDRLCNLLVASLDNWPEIKMKGSTYVLTWYFISSSTVITKVSVFFIKHAVLAWEAAEKLKKREFDAYSLLWL